MGRREFWLTTVQVRKMCSQRWAADQISLRNQQSPGTVYRDMLENFLVAQLDDDVGPHLLFQQDRTPPLLPWHARNFLYNHYTGKSIGHGDPVSWPRRSPYLTFLDFTVGDLLRISRTCLRFPTTLNCCGSRFHKPSCMWTSRWWTGHRQNWNVIGTYDMLRRERLLNLVNPRQIKRGCSALHFTSLNFVLNPLNPELNPICYLLALLGAHHFLHVSRIRVKLLTFRRLMSYIYIWSTHSWCF